MPQSDALVDTLKSALKQQRVTYATVADELDMSEANVKRMFASRRFTLERIEEICAIIGLELSDLFAMYEESRQRITTLSREQEKQLVSDSGLLLVAVSVRNRLSFEDIIRLYDFTEPDCIRHLARLDKLKIIDLLPGNRIKLRIDENFHWLHDGPIERFYEQQIQSQFLKSTFGGELDQRRFQFGLLSENSISIMQRRMKALAKEFAELLRQDSKLPVEQRHSIGCILAMRPWEFDVFEAMKRQ